LSYTREPRLFFTEGCPPSLRFGAATFAERGWPANRNRHGGEGWWGR